MDKKNKLVLILAFVLVLVPIGCSDEPSQPTPIVDEPGYRLSITVGSGWMRHPYGTVRVYGLQSRKSRSLLRNNFDGAVFYPETLQPDGAFVNADYYYPSPESRGIQIPREIEGLSIANYSTKILTGGRYLLALARKKNTVDSIATLIRFTLPSMKPEILDAKIPWGTVYPRPGSEDFLVFRTHKENSPVSLLVNSSGQVIEELTNHIDANGLRPLQWQPWTTNPRFLIVEDSLRRLWRLDIVDKTRLEIPVPTGLVIDTRIERIYRMSPRGDGVRVLHLTNANRELPFHRAMAYDAATNTLSDLISPTIPGLIHAPQVMMAAIMSSSTLEEHR